MLTSRERGQRFRVNKEGELVKLSGFWNKFDYFFNRSKIQSAVKDAITNTVSQINNFEDQKEAIETLFFKTLTPLSSRVYDRGALTQQMAYYLSPELQKTKENYTTNQTSAKELALKVEKVRLAVNLGTDFKPCDEGHNGTYFGRDRLGTKMVVFKPSDEESLSANSPKLIAKIKQLFFKVFPCLKLHNNIKREYAYLNEVGAGKVDQILGFGLVPMTKLETFESEQFSGETEKKGSCQLFVNNATMAQVDLELPSFDFFLFWKRFVQKLWLKWFGDKMPTIMDQDQLEKLAIFDFITGNQDRHLNNLLVKEKKAVAIDNGIAFPYKATTLVSTGTQYFWKHLPEAKKPFSEESNKWIKKLEDQEAFFDQLKNVMQDEEINGFDDEQQKQMEKRILILQAVLTQKKSIKYLGSIKTKEDFKRAYKELKLSLIAK